MERVASQFYKMGVIFLLFPTGLTPVTLTSEKTVLQENLLACWNGADSHPCRINCPHRHCDEYDSQLNVEAGAVRDFRSFEGNKLDIEENNITVISCNCSNLDFHLVLKNGHVKRYISRNKTHGCYTYEIVSTSEKMQVVHNEEVVATAEDDLKKMVLKCTSKYASWKILKTCWNALESHPCRIDCPYRHCRECKDNSGLDVADHNTPASSPGHKSVIKNETHTQNSCDSPNLILYTMLIILAILMALAMIYLCWKYVKYRVETREKKEEKYFTSCTSLLRA
ncbi:uncharacterized protein LOC135138132 isoform X2 [Zophobas morio]|uniref:uncharacterized protein LOC135138132 isoform X2 n=1 Tax=Zophobas morio TaxID=2755281 RepID=UPI003083CFDD